MCMADHNPPQLYKEGGIPHSPHLHLSFTHRVSFSSGAIIGVLGALGGVLACLATLLGGRVASPQVAHLCACSSGVHHSSTSPLL